MAEKLAELYVDIEGRLTKLESSLKQGEQRVRSSGERMTMLAKKAGVALGAMFGGAFVLQGMKKGFDALVKLDKGMRNVNTITRVSEDELKSLTRQVVELSSKYGEDSGGLADALYQTVSAGVKTADAINFLDTAIRSAKAGITDTKTSVDALTTIINAYGLSVEDAEKVSDLMFATVERGKTTFEELAVTYSTVAKIASVSGVSFEDLSGAVATLTKQGVPTAQAMTQLRQAIIALNENLGDGWTQTMTLQEGLEEMIKKAGGSQNKLKELVGRVEGMNAILSLTGDSAKMFSEDLAEIGDASGKTAKAMEEQTKSFEHRISVFTTTTVNSLMEIVHWFVNIYDAVKEADEAFEDWAFGWLKTQKEITSQGSQNTFTDLVNRGLVKMRKESKATTDVMEKGFNRSGATIKELEAEAKLLEESLMEMTPEVARNSYEFKKLQEITDRLDIQKKFDDARQEAQKLVEYVEGITDEYEKTLEKVQTIDNTIKDTATTELEVLLLERERAGVMEDLVRNSKEYLESMKQLQEARAKAGSERAEKYLTDEGFRVGEDIKSDIKEKGELPEVKVPDKPDALGSVTDDERVKLALMQQQATQMQIMLGQAQMIQQAFSLAGHTFVGQLAQGISLADTIAQSILSILSLFQPTSGFGVGGLVASLFGKHGGTFLNGKKIASFAGGGDFIVPPYNTQDSFPLLVSSGERVKVTPTQKVSQEAEVMKQVVTRIEALNANIVGGSGRKQKIQVPLYISSKKIGEAIFEVENDMVKSGVRKDEF